MDEELISTDTQSIEPQDDILDPPMIDDSDSENETQEEEEEEVKTTPFTTIYDRFLSKITDDMYVELTPEDTIRDLQSLLLEAIPGFEFPRCLITDYTISTEIKKRSEITDNDFVIGVIWHELDDLLDNEDSSTDAD